MAVGKFIPNMTQTVQVIVAVAILACLLKYLPIPENVKQLFRI